MTHAKRAGTGDADPLLEDHRSGERASSTPTKLPAQAILSTGDRAEQPAASTQIKSWRDVLPVHPAANLFPLMSADELKALGEDIRAHGLKSPISLLRDPDGKFWLLDGRNRLDGMGATGQHLEFDLDQSAKVACGLKIDGLYGYLDWYREEEGFDPFAFVISANIHRRHLTAEQKRDLITKLLKATPEKSNRTIAEQIKSNHHTVGAVRAELQSTGTITQLEKTVGKDGKARKQPTPAATRPRRLHTPPPDHPPTRLLPVDSGPGAASEVERLQARVEQLQNEKRLLELKIVGLESEVEELKAQLAAARPAPPPVVEAAPATDDGLDIPDYLLVKNRVPLERPQIQQLNDAPAACPPTLLEQQAERNRQKALVRIKAKKSGATGAIAGDATPAALDVIWQWPKEPAS